MPKEGRVGKHAGEKKRSCWSHVKFVLSSASIAVFRSRKSDANAVKLSQPPPQPLQLPPQALVKALAESLSRMQ